MIFRLFCLMTAINCFSLYSGEERFIFSHSKQPKQQIKAPDTKQPELSGIHREVIRWCENIGYEVPICNPESPHFNFKECNNFVLDVLYSVARKPGIYHLEASYHQMAGHYRKPRAYLKNNIIQ